MSHITRKPFFGGLRPGMTQKRPAQLQRLARVLKFQLEQLYVFLVLGSEQRR